MKKIVKDLIRRIRLNRERLRDARYQYSDVFNQNNSWPGDFEGRDILALTSLYYALEGYKEEQDDVLNQLKDIFNHLGEHVNEDGYFGELFNGEYVDEQQVSGNSWFLRGLIKYYEITKEEKYLKQIQLIVRKYLIPISIFYENYPITHRERGGVGGSLDGSFVNGWKLSTDIGCAFIMIDGMTAAYELTKNKELKGVIERIIKHFLTINYIDLECQTHATLSCARGILRFYKTTQETKYLHYAEQILNAYVVSGMTYDYANINWFKREDTWTEPCCIIDNMILAKELYLCTKKKEYLDLFNRVYVNTIRTFQRDNGGAGCSTCAINDHYELKMYLYEAYFCCTMRLGNGFNEIVDFALIKEDYDYYLNFGCAIEYEDEEAAFNIDAELYQTSHLRVKIIKEGKGNLFIRLPNNALVEGYVIKDGYLKISLRKQDEIDLFVSLPLAKENGLYFYGDMLLTKKEQKNDHQFIIDNQAYSYINDNSKFSEEELKGIVEYVK